VLWLKLPRVIPLVVSKTSTYISSIVSRTLPFAQTYVNKTVLLDQSLAVTPLLNLLQTSNNATIVAEGLASELNEVPIALLSRTYQLVLRIQ
jgi:hypothetical protein